MYWPNSTGGRESGTYVFGMPAGAPETDGGALGFDTLTSNGSNKNVMTVGNLTDAVSGTDRNPQVPLVASPGIGPVDRVPITPTLPATGPPQLRAAPTP